MMSAPPRSAIRAVATSYAVTMTSGRSPLLASTSGTVTGESAMCASLCVQRPLWAAGEKRLTGTVYSQRDEQPGAQEDGDAKDLAPSRIGSKGGLSDPPEPRSVKDEIDHFIGDEDDPRARDDDEEGKDPQRVLR